MKRNPANPTNPHQNILLKNALCLWSMKCMRNPKNMRNRHRKIARLHISGRKLSSSTLKNASMSPTTLSANDSSSAGAPPRAPWCRRRTGSPPGPAPNPAELWGAYPCISGWLCSGGGYRRTGAAPAGIAIPPRPAPPRASLRLRVRLGVVLLDEVTLTL